MTWGGYCDAEWVATPIRTNTLLSLRPRTATEAALSPMQNLLRPNCCNLTQSNCSTAETHERTQPEHGVNMRRTGTGTCNPMWGRIEIVVGRSVVTQIETF
jgi:hypothetical protein